MSSFADYAQYYDLFYRSKDYFAESAFVLALLRERQPSVARILELGCGTGGHAVHFAESGCSVMGVDLSRRMVDVAQERFLALPANLRNRFCGVQGDASDFSTSEKFDAVVSLFHVASYQTRNEALLGFFRSASSALNPGGLFVFDYWYGPAVLSDRPHARERQETADDGTSVVRKTEPVMHFEENVVDVNYAFNIRRGGVEHLFHETHRMRYLFVPELRMYGGLAGFILEEAATWMDRKPLTDASWYGYAVMRKVGV